MRKVQRIRIVACVVASLVIAAFVQLYGLLQANILQYVYKVRMEALPLPTGFYARHSSLGYLLPVLGLLLLWIKDGQAEEDAVRFEVCLKAVYLLALIWLLGCILSWQLPFYLPADFIE